MWVFNSPRPVMCGDFLGQHIPHLPDKDYRCHKGRGEDWLSMTHSHFIESVMALESWEVYFF